MLFSTSCSNKIVFKKRYDKIDEEASSYVKEFVFVSRGRIKPAHLKNLTIGFRSFNDEQNVIGTCYPWIKEIHINKDWWEKNQSSEQRVSLMFHELGHCILNRPHTAEQRGDLWGEIEAFLMKLGLIKVRGMLPDYCPSSLMHPIQISDYCLNEHYQYYLDELFDAALEKNYVEKRFPSN
jgi:hypothetical protein